MNYEHIVPAVFVERPNRFIAYAMIGSQQVTCHVKNTGRCRELLLPGADVILQYHPDAAGQGRKTEYSLIQVYKKTDHTELINIDSQAPNQVAYEWFSRQPVIPVSEDLPPAAAGALPHITDLKREVRYGNSRFDLAFCIHGKPALAEVKGVTLETDKIASFPDAPTIRGVKHLNELMDAANAGFETYLLFVIAMKGIRRFEPNAAIHPEFAAALAAAAAAGVHILAYDCMVKPDSLNINRPVPVCIPSPHP